MRNNNMENIYNSYEDIMKDYNLNKKQAKLVWSLVYEYGHSSGEYDNYVYDFAGLAEDILENK